MYCLWLLFKVQQRSWLAATETIYSSKPKTLFGPLQKKSANRWYLEPCCPRFHLLQSTICCFYDHVKGNCNLYQAAYAISTMFPKYIPQFSYPFWTDIFLSFYWLLCQWVSKYWYVFKSNLSKKYYFSIFSVERWGHISKTKSPDVTKRTQHVTDKGKKQKSLLTSFSCQGRWIQVLRPQACKYL